MSKAEFVFYCKLSFIGTNNNLVLLLQRILQSHTGPFQAGGGDRATAQGWLGMVSLIPSLTKKRHHIVAVLLLFPLGNYANPAIDLFQDR